MFAFLTKAIRQRRALRYAKAFPDEITAVQAILAALELGAKSARDAAEMLAGRELSDAEWLTVSPRWERAWLGVI
jgi:hypothetical protein